MYTFELLSLVLELMDISFPVEHFTGYAIIERKGKDRRIVIKVRLHVTFIISSYAQPSSKVP